MNGWNYHDWVTAQATTIEQGMRDFARRGISDIAVWCIPSRPGAPGRLVLAQQYPADLGATDIVRIGPHGTTIARCPYSHLRSLLFDACRSLPIVPMEGGSGTSPPIVQAMVVLPNRTAATVVARSISNQFEQAEGEG